MPVLLVIDDEASILEAFRATFDEPRQAAAGIHTVLVNGVPVLADARPTGALPGHSIRSTRH